MKKAKPVTVKFKKIIGDIFLNNLGIFKYESDNGERIALIVEHVVKGTELGQINFDSSEKYSEWFESVAPGNDYNSASLVNTVIDAILERA